MAPLVGRGRTVVSVHDMSVVRMCRTHPARRLFRIPLALLGPMLANLVVVRGDPLDERSHIQRVVIAGKEISLDSRQVDQFKKYMLR